MRFVTVFCVCAVIDGFGTKTMGDGFELVMALVLLVALLFDVGHLLKKHS